MPAGVTPEAPEREVARAVRFGLVGYGAWGSCHARAIHKEATLTAVCAATEASRERARQELGPGVAVCTDYRELIDRDDVDVVDIVVPNYLHREVAVAALAAGKHVLLEKPMATTVADAAAIAAAAHRHSRILAIGHEARLSPQWGKIKELIDGGAIGRPLTAAIHLFRFPYRQGAQGWRYDRARVGDWTLEEPIHYFDLIRWFMATAGDPQTVYARASSVRPQERPGLYDNLMALIAFPGDGTGLVTQTLAGYHYHLRGEVLGTDGSIRAWWSGELDRTERPQYKLEYSDGKQVHHVPLEGTPGERFELEHEIRHVARCVVTGEAPLTGPEDGLWAVRLCLAAEESARRGGPISVAAAPAASTQGSGGDGASK